MTEPTLALDLETVDEAAAIRTRPTAAGRPSRALPEPLDVSELTLEDVESVRANGSAAGAVQVQKIRGSHHYIARATAAGLKQTEVSRLIGYSPATISALLAQPAMKELVAEYGEKLTDATYDFVQRLSALGMMSLDTLEEAFEQGSDVSPEFALKVAQFTADRIGHGPTSTVNGNKVSLNAHFTSDQLVEIREGLRDRRLNQGGRLELIDPADKHQTTLEVEKRNVPLSEGPKETSGKDNLLPSGGEGTASTPEALGYSPIGDDL